MELEMLLLGTVFFTALSIIAAADNHINSYFIYISISLICIILYLALHK